MKKGFKHFGVILVGLLMISCGSAFKEESAVVNLTKAEFSKRIIDLESDSEEWIFLGDKPAIVDFYADWCGPCRQLAPIMEELADEFAGEVDFFKVNVDNEAELSEIFGVESIPMLLFIPAEGYPDIVEGGMSKDELRNKINQLLKK